jgi:hypothetical protein
MFRSCAVAILLALAPATAFAYACPSVMAEIDEALPTASLSDEDRQRVEELRAQGEKLHIAGDHDGSMEALEEAKQLLGL